jgi:alpha-tubulin suppressor-like RCC1 family protein
LFKLLAIFQRFYYITAVYFTQEKKTWRYVDPIVEISKGKNFMLAITQRREAIYYHTTSGRVEILKIDDPNLISSGLARYFVQGVKKGHHKHMVLAGGIGYRASLGTGLEDANITCSFEQPVTVNSGPTQPLEKLQDVQSISCGPSHTAFIKDTRLAVVGNNYNGQLGMGNRQNIIKFTEFVNFEVPILQVVCTDKGIFVRDRFGCV